jgi:hypothetical protein
MRDSREHALFIGTAVVLPLITSGLAIGLVELRNAPIVVSPVMEIQASAPIASSSNLALSDASAVSEEETPPTEDAAIGRADEEADNLDELSDEDAGTNFKCGPLLWIEVESEAESDRKLLAEYPLSFPIYKYVRKAARPFQDAVSELLPNRGNRRKCGQGVTFGYDLQSGPATQYCENGRCYWYVRATIIDDRSYRSKERVPRALPWVYGIEVERIGAPIIVHISPTPQDPKRFTNMSEAIRFVQELARSDK